MANVTTALEDTGRRALACHAWRWDAGILCTNGFRTFREPSGFLWLIRAPHEPHLGGMDMLDDDAPSRDKFIPDLSDAATRGVVLQMVRGAYNEPGLFLGVNGRGWRHVYRAGRDDFDEPQELIIRTSGRVGWGGSGEVVGGKDEIEALVVALERAPKRKGGTT